MKEYKLTASDGSVYSSSVRGAFGGYKPKKIYGELECKDANRNLISYARSRVFFSDEYAAIAAGYRPCAKCLPDRYQEWKAGGEPRSAEYPWHRTPKI